MLGAGWSRPFRPAQERSNNRTVILREARLNEVKECESKDLSHFQLRDQSLPQNLFTAIQKTSGVKRSLREGQSLEPLIPFACAEEGHSRWIAPLAFSTTDRPEVEF